MDLIVNNGNPLTSTTKTLLGFAHY